MAHLLMTAPAARQRLTRTARWAALGWTVALDAVWAAAMAAATMFLVVLGAVVGVVVEVARPGSGALDPSADWFVSRMLVAIVLGVAASLAVTLVLDRGRRGLGWLVGLAGSAAGAVTALVAYDLLTGVNLLTVVA
jgi:hypothetical protein